MSYLIGCCPRNDEGQEIYYSNGEYVCGYCGAAEAEAFSENKSKRRIGTIIWIEPKDEKMPYRKVKVDNTITTTDDIRIIN